MKKRIIFLAIACALAVVSCGQKKGQTENVQVATDLQQAEQDETYNKVYTVEEIRDAWTKKDIPVPNGGKQPGIVELLAAFNSVWTTEVYVELPEVKKGRTYFSTTNLDSGGGSEIDLLLGYANVMPGDSPGDRLHAALWRRAGGHTLFAVSLESQEGDNPPQALCFFDYDPGTQSMKPEANNAVLKFRPAKGNTPVYLLPEEGTAVIVGERDADYNTVWSVFEWDGKKFSQVNRYSDGELMQAVSGRWMSEDESFPFTFAVNMNSDDNESISDCGIYGSTEYEASFLPSLGTLGFYVAPDDPNSGERPELICHFYPTKDGKLRGGYYMRQAGNREWHGTMTLAKIGSGPEEAYEEAGDDVE